MQHGLPSMKYYIRPSHIITRVYRRVQREVGNEVSSTNGRMGTDRDDATEADDSRLGEVGFYVCG